MNELLNSKFQCKYLASEHNSLCSLFQNLKPILTVVFQNSRNIFKAIFRKAGLHYPLVYDEFPRNIGK